MGIFSNNSTNQSLWDDYSQELGNNWSKDYHRLDKPIPYSSHSAKRYGMSIIDWDNTYKKRIGKASISDLMIPFQYIDAIPKWEKSANWQDISEIIGRFEALSLYTNSSAQEFSIKLIYNAEALKNIDNNGIPSKSHWTLENIEKYTHRLQSLVYPMYDGRFGSPPKLMMNIGNSIRELPVVIKTVTVDLLSPYHIETLLSQRREITLACRVYYPLWQAITHTEVYTATLGNKVFAYQKIDSNKLRKIEKLSR